MRVPRDMLLRGTIRAAVTIRRTAMRGVAITALAITTEVLATIMADRVIHTTDIIHPGPLRPTGITHMDPMGATRIHTMEVIPTVTLTTSQGMVTTLEPLQRYSAGWVSLATIAA